MTSTHLSRVSNEYRPIWVIAEANNKKPKVLIGRKLDGKRSQSNVFMGC